MRGSAFLRHSRGATLGLTGLLGTAIIAAAAVHLLWASIAGDSPALGAAVESLSRWADDSAREGALILIGVGFLLVALLLCTASLMRAREGRVSIAKHGRATTQVDRRSLSQALERALTTSVREGVRVSISRRRRVNVTLPGLAGESVADAASTVSEAVSDWCARHGVPCKVGRVTLEAPEAGHRVDPAPKRRRRRLR